MPTRHMALAGAVAAVLGLSGAAFAQTVAPTAPAPNPSVTGQPMTPQPPRSVGPVAPAPAVVAPAPLAPNVTTMPSRMTAPQSTAPNAARSDTAPLSGANSFTEGQARSRIADAGYADVQGLRLDEQGIWRGRANRNGRSTGVAMDYQGNIVATD